MTAIYETIRCHKLKIWNFEAHFTRLSESAKKLGLTLPYTRVQILEQITNKLKTSNYLDARLKIELKNNEINFTITELKDEALSSKLVTFASTRPSPEFKFSDRKTENQALNFAHKNNAIDAILVEPKGNLTEGSISNFFIVQNQTLITPSTNILPGTTRQLVLDIATQLQISVIFRDIHINEIPHLNEAFITNAIKQIVPISHINEYAILTCPGPITIKILEQFNKNFERFKNA